MERTATRSESLLRPREIQVRIRAGQSPETVAAAAQTSVERVMAFATPVLAERAFVAQQAARASVRRRGGDGPVGLLGDAVATRLESVGLAPEAAEWDAWRREDGRWTVVAAWCEAEEDRQAQFTYDAMGRYVVAEDDPARWLVGERRTEAVREPEPLAAEEAGQLALGDDALQVVTGRPLTAVPPIGPVLTAVLGADTDGDGGTGTPTVEQPTGAAAAAEAVRADGEPTEDLTETVRAVRAVGEDSGEPVARTQEATVGEGDGLFEDTGLRSAAGGAQGAAPERRTSRSTNGSRSRRSMPSWDDIMLGSAPRGD